MSQNEGDSCPRQKGASSLLVRNGRLGVMRGDVFEAHTNFAIDVTCVVTTPEDAQHQYGFIYHIRTADGIERCVACVYVCVYICMWLR